MSLRVFERFATFCTQEKYLFNEDIFLREHENTHVYESMSVKLLKYIIVYTQTFNVYNDDNFLSSM